MGKETSRRFKELSEEGDSCLVSLRSIDKRVGETFLKLREVSKQDFGGVLRRRQQTTLTSDVASGQCFRVGKISGFFFSRHILVLFAVCEEKERGKNWKLYVQNMEFSASSEQLGNFFTRTI